MRGQSVARRSTVVREMRPWHDVRLWWQRTAVRLSALKHKYVLAPDTCYNGFSLVSSLRPMCCLVSLPRFANP